MRETRVQSLGREDLPEKEMATTPVLLPGKSRGQRSLVGYDPWGRREWDSPLDWAASLSPHLDYTPRVRLHHSGSGPAAACTQKREGSGRSTKVTAQQQSSSECTVRPARPKESAVIRPLRMEKDKLGGNQRRSWDLKSLCSLQYNDLKSQIYLHNLHCC